ncbi:hypothetical protein SELMODRAFT_425631 [Selaginella moellendorffii]|uniref:Uncharacterized protein n=1 Tax=Selaginella moellendorffii TaxID=88036 RepID=D8STR0_SELML|nr:hypothetical protein SELMODRAFT_425631 [Selaginella moellendorffii]
MATAKAATKEMKQVAIIAASLSLVVLLLLVLVLLPRLTQHQGILDGKSVNLIRGRHTENKRFGGKQAGKKKRCSERTDFRGHLCNAGAKNMVMHATLLSLTRPFPCCWSATSSLEESQAFPSLVKRRKGGRHKLLTIDYPGSTFADCDMPPFCALRLRLRLLMQTNKIPFFARKKKRRKSYVKRDTHVPEKERMSTSSPSELEGRRGGYVMVRRNASEPLASYGDDHAVPQV